MIDAQLGVEAALETGRPLGIGHRHMHVMGGSEIIHQGIVGLGADNADLPTDAVRLLLQVLEVVVMGLNEVGNLVGRRQGCQGQRVVAILHQLAGKAAGVDLRLVVGVKQHQKGTPGIGAGGDQFLHIGIGQVDFLEQVVRQHFHQIGHQLAFVAFRQVGKLKLENLGQLQQHRCGHLAVVVLDQVQIAGADPQLFGQLGLRLAAVAPQPADFRPQFEGAAACFLAACLRCHCRLGFTCL